VTKILAGLLALGALALPASPAVAAPVRSLCDYQAVSGPGSDMFTGRLYGIGAFDSPDTASVTCAMYVDGVLVAEGTFTGTVLVVGSVPVEFTARSAYGTVVVCETADWGAGQTQSCSADASSQIPPQELYDLLDAVLAPVPGWHDRTCDATRLADGAAPGWFGRAWTNADGDVFVGVNQFWYC
jgi:hypothetical protein